MAFDFPNAPTVGQLYGAYRWDGEKWTVVGGAGMVNLTTQATGVLQAAQEPAHTGDVTNPQGSLAMTLSGGVVGLAQMAPAAPTTIIGNNASIVATPQALTGTQVTAMLDTFAGNKKALVPASNGSITNFLRGDGSWVPPPAASGYLPLTGGTLTGDLVVNAGVTVAPGAGKKFKISIPYTGDLTDKPHIDGQSGSAKVLMGSSSGVDRWGLSLGNGALENGSDFGSNLTIDAYNDAGAWLGTPLTIERASGYVVINGNGGVPAPASTAPFGHAILRLNKTGTNVSQISGMKDGKLRWAVNLGDGTAESGANAGSNLGINRYDDSGAYIDSPLQILRSSGAATFTGPITQSSPAGQWATFNANKPTSGLASQYLGSKAGIVRWAILAGDQLTETGSGNTGANFGISRYSDAGAYLDTPMSIQRSSGVTSFSQPIVNGSDRRLKDDIQPLTGALAQVEALQGVSYVRRDSTRREIGLIAQEVQAVVPELVFENPVGPEQADWLGMKPGDPLLGIAYGNLVAVLIEAVKELSAKFAALEASIAP